MSGQPPPGRRPDSPPPSSPEASALEEALLVQTWADSLEPAEEIPEEVLGLLDGTLVGREAERVRQRLVRDPALAKAAGELVASWRDSGPTGEAPGHLLAEAIDLGAAPDPASSGFLARLTGWWQGASAPGLAAAAAAVLLVSFVLVERGGPPAPDPVLRAKPASAGSIALVAPAADAWVQGPLDVSWQAVPGAVRYRVVLVDADNGEVVDIGHTDQTRLSAAEAELEQRFGSGTERALHWIVRARLLDGTEISSEPRRVTWSTR